MRIRTMKQAYEAIKASDPETDLTYYAFRSKVINGEIPHVKSGNKYLIDIDRLEKHLSPDQAPPPAGIKSPEYGSLRQIAE